MRKSPLFEGGTSPAGIRLPAGISSTGSHVFKNCVSLATISMSDGVTEIGSEAFGG